VAERAVGADISPEMIRRTTELASGLTNVEFVVADSEALPFPDAAFTAVLCTASFHHYPNPRRALAAMARVLDLDGRLVIADGVGDILSARIADRILPRRPRPHSPLPHGRVGRAARRRGLLGHHIEQAVRRWLRDHQRPPHPRHVAPVDRSRDANRKRAPTGAIGIPQRASSGLGGSLQRSRVLPMSWSLFARGGPRRRAVISFCLYDPADV
jgi:SAM-dependent methyltransferase